jgi:hypothetical protein
VGLIIGAQAATTWTVCASGCPYTSIKAAIAAPTTLDGDTLAIAAGVYTEAGISVNKCLTLQGEDAATTMVQAAATSGTASDRVFTIASGVTVTLQDLTIRYGNVVGSGGGLENHGTLTLTHSTVRGNKATGYYGGGLYNWYAALTLTNSIVASNPLGGDCRHTHSSITSQGLQPGQRYQLPADRPYRPARTDPQLGPLQGNGGPTLTQALSPGSPAIDAIPWGTNGCGTTLISDQRWQARPQPAGGPCDVGAYEVEVAGQALGAWVTGFTPQTVTCENVTTGQAVTLSDLATSWDCEAAGLAVTTGNQVALRVRGPVETGATDVGEAVTGMTLSRGSCTNCTTGQQVKLQHLAGTTAASCVAAGLVVHSGDKVQISCRGSRSNRGRPPWTESLDATRNSRPMVQRHALAADLWAIWLHSPRASRMC